ncbi:unnamed protein product [Lampetra fluviatilis]
MTTMLLLPNSPRAQRVRDSSRGAEGEQRAAAEGTNGSSVEKSQGPVQGNRRLPPAQNAPLPLLLSLSLRAACGQRESRAARSAGLLQRLTRQTAVAPLRHVDAVTSQAQLGP